MTTTARRLSSPYRARIRTESPSLAPDLIIVCGIMAWVLIGLLVFGALYASGVDANALAGR